MAMLGRYIALTGMLAVASVSSAAEIVVTPLANDTLITVSGDLQDGDARKFASITGGLTFGTVLLRSDGGSAYAALSIGRTIKKLGLSTRVSDKTGACKSACALIWLAGSNREFEGNALIGFHAAYKMANGKAVVSGAANAIIGGYMRDLGLSDEVIAYATEAEPGSMKYLSKSDADKIRLSATFISAGQVVNPENEFEPQGAVPIPHVLQATD